MAIQAQQKQRSSTRFNRPAFIAAVKQSCTDAIQQRRRQVADANREHTETLVGEHDQELVGVSSLHLDCQNAAKAGLAAGTKNLLKFLEMEPAKDSPHGKVYIVRWRGELRAYVVYPGSDEGYGLVSIAGIEDRLDDLAREFGFAELKFCSDEGLGKAFFNVRVGTRISQVGEVIKVH